MRSGSGVCVRAFALALVTSAAGCSDDSGGSKAHGLEADSAISAEGGDPSGGLLPIGSKRDGGPDAGSGSDAGSMDGGMDAGSAGGGGGRSDPGPSAGSGSTTKDSGTAGSGGATKDSGPAGCPTATFGASVFGEACFGE